MLSHIVQLAGVFLTCITLPRVIANITWKQSTPSEQIIAVAVGITMIVAGGTL